MKKRQMKCKHCGSGDYISLDAAAHFDNELGDWVLGTMYDEEITCNNIACMRDMRGSMDWDDFEDFEVDVATITPIVAPPADELWLPDDLWAAHDEYPVCDWQHEVNNDDTRLGYIDWVNHQLHLDDFETEVQPAAPTKKYHVHLIETVEYDVYVEASNKEDAEEEATVLWASADSPTKDFNGVGLGVEVDYVEAVE